MEQIFDKIDIEKIVNDTGFSIGVLNALRNQLNYLNDLPFDVLLDVTNTIIDEIELNHTNYFYDKLTEERRKEVKKHTRILNSSGFLSWVTVENNIKPFRMFWKEVHRILIDTQKTSNTRSKKQKQNDKRTAVLGTCLKLAQEKSEFDLTELDEYAQRLEVRNVQSLRKYINGLLTLEENKGNYEKVVSMLQKDLTEFPKAFLSAKKTLSRLDS